MIDDVKYRLLESKWVTYPRAKQIIGMMEDLLYHPKKTRMPNMMLFGHTNNGKTEILKHFARKHQVEPNPLEDFLEIPVVYVQCDPVPDEKRVYSSILGSLNLPVRSHTNSSVLKLQACHILRKIKCRLLIIDEIQHVLASTPSKQRGTMDTIKYLSNELDISVVLAGTEEAMRVVGTGSQLSNRFEPVKLPKWELDREYATLFVSLLEQFDVKGDKFTYGKQFIQDVYSLSGGYLGEIVAIIRRCCILSYENGSLELHSRLLDQINYIQPDKRRNVY